jgi:hypothetical protein
MPAKKSRLSPEEQRKRFESEVRSRIEAGELTPIEADAALDALVKRGAKGKT